MGKTWLQAKNNTGGNMLISKRPETFLPGLWPVYFKKTKKCFIWDLIIKKIYRHVFNGSWNKYLRLLKFRSR